MHIHVRSLQLDARTPHVKCSTMNIDVITGRMYSPDTHPQICASSNYVLHTSITWTFRHNGWAARLNTNGYNACCDAMHAVCEVSHMYIYIYICTIPSRRRRAAVRHTCVYACTMQRSTNTIQLLMRCHQCVYKCNVTHIEQRAQRLMRCVFCAVRLLSYMCAEVQHNT